MPHTDTLGDILKEQEQKEAGRTANPFRPLMCRIDGRAFSSFTHGLQKPFDERFVNLMVATTRHLVTESEALLGYCQSDEITLYWHLDKRNYSNRDFLFRGKYQKLTSILASMAGAFFTGNLPEYIPEKVGQYPVFDCRVWNVPNLEYVYKNFLWRLNDATKNSVSMYAQSLFSHKSLQGVTCEEMKTLLKQIGKPWEELPRAFTHGTYIKRQRVLVGPESLDMSDIPFQYRPTKPIIRAIVKEWVPDCRIQLGDFVA